MGVGRRVVGATAWMARKVYYENNIHSSCEIEDIL